MKDYKKITENLSRNKDVENLLWAVPQHVNHTVTVYATFVRTVTSGL